MLTPHCSAASGIVVPPSIVSTTRLRKSAEYGFAIHAGLLPAGSLNHIRAATGIPDSAFSGNALAFGKGSQVLRRRLLPLVGLPESLLDAERNFPAAALNFFARGTALCAVGNQASCMLSCFRPLTIMSRTLALAARASSSPSNSLRKKAERFAWGQFINPLGEKL